MFTSYIDWEDKKEMDEVEDIVESMVYPTYDDVLEASKIVGREV